MEQNNNQRKIEEKSAFSILCVGVPAIAAAPKAGQAIRQMVDYVKDKTGGEKHGHRN